MRLRRDERNSLAKQMPVEIGDDFADDLDLDP